LLRDDHPRADTVTEPGESSAGQTPEPRTARIVHKAYKFGTRQKSEVAWRWSDIGITLQLALLLLPVWLTPDRLWTAAWRMKSRLRTRTGPGIQRTAKTIQTALGIEDRRRAEEIARDLRASANELKTQSLKTWRPGGWHPRVVLEGEAHLETALAGGKGAILWVAPFVFYSGPTKIALHDQGYTVSHLSSPLHGFSGTRYGIAVLNRIQCVPEDRTIKERIVFDRNAPSTAMRRMVRALKAGEVVSIAAASTEGLETIDAPFFGGVTPVAVGAPRLAGLTGAPLLPLFAVRDGDGAFRISIEAPIPLDPKQTSDARCVTAVIVFFQRLEPWVRRYPEQWRGWSKWRRQ
jgi:lauroyl/myristoyl acyltransferase